MLMGAMLGAGMGLVQGKDPLKSALIGGATAGIGNKLMGAEGLFNVGADQLTTDLASNSLGGMQAVSDGAMGAMNPETISMFTPDGTSMLGTQNSVFGLGDPMSNQYMNPSLTQNLGAESVSNLSVPNTGLLSNPGAPENNILQKGTDFITNQFDDMKTSEKLGFGMQGADLIAPKEYPVQPAPPPQVIPGKQSTPSQPMAINVQRPGVSFTNAGQLQDQLTPQQKKQLGLL